jgi:hypothetical protein
MSARDLALTIQTLPDSEQHELFTLLARDDEAFRDYIEDVMDAATIRHAMETEQELVPWETAKTELNALYGLDH